MTKEKLETRLVALREEQKQLLASMNFVAGAIRVLEDLLKEDDPSNDLKE